LSGVEVVIVTSVIIVAILLVGYFYGQKVKQRLDTPKNPQMRAPIKVSVSHESAEYLARSLREPLIIKQALDGTRVQIDNRPLVPLVMLTDQGAQKAIREVVVAAGEKFGTTWMAVASTLEDGTVSVQQLS
jgi:hypothetical protein